MLELSESSFRLNGTVATKQLSLFGGNILVRLLTHLLKFPADVDLFSPVLIFCLAADRTIRTVRAVFTAGNRDFSHCPIFGILCIAAQGL